MSSTQTRLENGVIVFLCKGRHRHPQQCTYCSRPATARCDFLTGKTETCDKVLCGQCSDKKGPIDHCRIHRLRGDIPGGITETNDVQRE